MVSVAEAVVDELTVVVKALDARVASHAVDPGGRPNCPAEETKVVELPSFLYSLVEKDVELPFFN